MRKQLEPNWEAAEKLYPAIKTLIEKYTAYCDENGDEDSAEYKKLENELHEMTGKDMSEYNLWEWWEGEGLEVLSFRIALPEPGFVQDISKDELLEIVNKIKTGTQGIGEDNFESDFSIYVDDYYHKLLKHNFKKYKYEYFNRQKGRDGKYFEYSAEEIAEKIWEK